MKRRSPNRNSGAPALFFGFLVSVITLSLLSLLFTLFAYKSADPTARVGIYSLLSLTLSGFIGSAMTSRRSGFNVALILAIICAVMLTATRLIFSSLDVSSVIALISYVGACLVGAYLSRPRARRSRR